MHFELAAQPEVLVDMRAALRRSSMFSTVDPVLRDNIVLVVSELASNAIAASLRSFGIVVDVVQAGQGFEVIVSNRGHSHVGHDSATIPAPTQLRGRGLAIVHLLADSLTLIEQRGNTIARAMVSPCAAEPLRC